MKHAWANLGRKLTSVSPELDRLRDCYLSLMQACLTGILYEDKPLKALGSEIYRPALREVGRDWPSMAHTMIGVKRLANLRQLSESVLQNKVPGFVSRSSTSKPQPIPCGRRLHLSHL